MTVQVQLIAISLANRPVAIMQFITKQQRHGDDPGWMREATDEAITAEIAKAGFGDNIGWRRIERDELPTDRMFRNAWTDTGKSVDVDVPKAREIAHTMRREKRETELVPLDKQINIDIADPAKVAAVEVKRKIIREKYAVMQVEIDKAETLDILKTILE